MHEKLTTVVNWSNMKHVKEPLYIYISSFLAEYPFVYDTVGKKHHQRGYCLSPVFAKTVNC